MVVEVALRMTVVVEAVVDFDDMAVEEVVKVAALHLKIAEIVVVVALVVVECTDLTASLEEVAVEAAAVVTLQHLLHAVADLSEPNI